MPVSGGIFFSGVCCRFAFTNLFWFYFKMLLSNLVFGLSFSVNFLPCIVLVMRKMNKCYRNIKCILLFHFYSDTLYNVFFYIKELYPLHNSQYMGIIVVITGMVASFIFQVGTKKSANSESLNRKSKSL